jgi:hypothetical protein
MDRTRLRLGGLVIVHVAAMGALDQIDRDNSAKVLWSSLFFSQVGLLAIWFSVSTGNWCWRIGPSLAGTAVLLWYNWAEEQADFDNLLRMGKWLVFPELAVAAGLLVARYGLRGLHLVHTNEQLLSGNRLQFSLRRLMAVIVAVACVTSGARAIRQFTTASNSVDDGHVDVIVLAVADITILGVCIASSWAALWASLGVGSPVGRSLLVVLSVGSVGLLSEYSCDSDDLSFVPTLLVGQSIFTMASLLVVRACGYRLVGRKEMATLA